MTDLVDTRTIELLLERIRKLEEHCFGKPDEPVRMERVTCPECHAAICEGTCRRCGGCGYVEQATFAGAQAHVITIVVKTDGSVQGDLDDAIALWPQCASEGEATTIDGQARSILSQAISRMLVSDIKAAAEPAPRPGSEVETQSFALQVQSIIAPKLTKQLSSDAIVTEVARLRDDFRLMQSERDAAIRERDEARAALEEADRHAGCEEAQDLHLEQIHQLRDDLDAAKAKLAAAERVVGAVRRYLDDLECHGKAMSDTMTEALRAFDATPSAPDSLAAPKRGSSRE